MSLAKTVDTTTSTVSRTVSSRRSLFGGAAAVVLGTGITAGVAASAADLLPSEGADAVLLAVCVRAEEEERLLRVADDLQSATVLKCGRCSASEVAREQSSTHFNAFLDFADQAAAIPASTVEGMRAKARIMYLNMNTQLEEGELTSLILRDLGWGV